MVSKVLAILLIAMAVAGQRSNQSAAQFNADPREEPVLNIVGGSEAREGQFPWQLRLNRNGKFVCGAVLITPDRALTAAHCLFDASWYTYTLVAGEHDAGVISGHEVSRTVASWTKHPQYNQGSIYANDIAILRLSHSFPSTSYIRGVSLTHSASRDYVGETCTLSGWGQTSGGSSKSTILRNVDMPVISQSKCESLWSGHSKVSITERHICVFEHGKSACTGDSGGPMICSGLLAGITSFGSESCSGSYPSVYSRISYYRNWISENL